MRSLRFCMLTTFYPPYNFGGDGIAVRRLSRALARRGHRVSVVHDIDAFKVLDSGPEPDSEPEPDGVEVIGLRSRLGTFSSLLTHQFGQPVIHGGRIRRFLQDRDFDVIHFNNVSLLGGPGVLALGDALKIYEAHEHWLVCPTHVLWRHNREVCDARECLRCVLRHRRPPQVWRYTGQLERQLDHVDLFIAKSEFSRDKHYEFGFPRSMRVLPYFLPDREEGDGASTRARPHPRPYFLFVGRLEKIKGLQDVIPAFEAYRSADLLVAGEGEYGPALRRRSRGIPGIRFLGRVSSAALKRYYRHAIACIVPSICYETFGIILIEAFRQGTPVIARRIGPFPEVVEACGGGLLFRTRDELLTAMESLQDDRPLRDRLSEAARKGFDAHWSESAVLPRYLELINEAGERRDSSAREAAGRRNGNRFVRIS